MNWHKHFDKRQLSEIEFSRVYATDFQHGTDGHNAKLIIAQQAALLSAVEEALLRSSEPEVKLRHVEELLGISE
jgi:hypothetical protein